MITGKIIAITGFPHVIRLFILNCFSCCHCWNFIGTSWITHSNFNLGHQLLLLNASSSWMTNKLTLTVADKQYNYCCWFKLAWFSKEIGNYALQKHLCNQTDCSIICCKITTSAFTGPGDLGAYQNTLHAVKKYTISTVCWVKTRRWRTQRSTDIILFNLASCKASSLPLPSHSWPIN